MNDNPYLLDTSAWFTLIEDEAGASRIEKICESGKVLVPWTILLEIHYITSRERGEFEADRRYAYIRQSPVEIIWEINEPVLLTAARLKSIYRLSFADGLIAAYAQVYKAILVHKDPEFNQLIQEIQLEALPFK